MSKGVLCGPRTVRQTDRHESEYRGHPFRVLGIFPSIYHQGSVQKETAYKIQNEVMLCMICQLFMMTLTLYFNLD